MIFNDSNRRIKSYVIRLQNILILKYYKMILILKILNKLLYTILTY